jgi:hypothetical protein
MSRYEILYQFDASNGLNPLSLREEIKNKSNKIKQIRTIYGKTSSKIGNIIVRATKFLKALLATFVRVKFIDLTCYGKPVNAPTTFRS